MTYLPEEYTHQTVLPTPFGKDLQTQVRAIEEKYRRSYPKIQYFPFRGDVTKLPATDGVSVVGEAGGSALDSLWGETVPAAQLGTGVWQQPHDGTGVAADPEIFYPEVILHGRIQREAKDKELKRYGFDQLRDLLLFVPSSVLDRYGISARAGDEFIWDGFRYAVLQAEATGYWKNTNLRLYVVMNCQQKKAGS